MSAEDLHAVEMGRETTQVRFEVAACLADLERRDEQLGDAHPRDLAAECAAEGVALRHPGADAVEHVARGRSRPPAAQDVEAAKQRQARRHEGGELLVQQQQVGGGDPPAAPAEADARAFIRGRAADRSPQDPLKSPRARLDVEHGE